MGSGAGIGVTTAAAIASVPYIGPFLAAAFGTWAIIYAKSFANVIIGIGVASVTGQDVSVTGFWNLRVSLS